MKNFTALHRFLHWAIAGCMFILLLTAFLKTYWMGREAVSNALKLQNLQLGDDIVKKIAHDINDPMFDWHIYAGYVLAALFVIRIIYMIAKGMKFPNPFAKNISFKEKIQGWIYVLFYVFVAVEAITGLILEFKLVEKASEKPFKEVHEWGIYWVPVFIILHFVGIYLAETDSKKGITSKMIGGE
ncbi:MAG: cytochrome b/b6 domain-containing protein [Flavobacteriaceae bacterium]|jgi:cytochrome b561|nr:cytochrome b/b6 domain-containing protein [Flavobacteriaceae bacterium]